MRHSMNTTRSSLHLLPTRRYGAKASQCFASAKNVEHYHQSQNDGLLGNDEDSTWNLVGSFALLDVPVNKTHIYRIRLNHLKIPAARFNSTTKIRIDWLIAGSKKNQLY